MVFVKDTYLNMIKVCILILWKMLLPGIEINLVNFKAWLLDLLNMYYFCLNWSKRFL